MGDQDKKKVDLLGRTLGETYRVERLIGKGGMGAVYEASHLRVDRQFAIKVLNDYYVDDPQIMARFRREAMLGSRLGHDNIVQVLDFNRTDEGDPYLVMEVLEGEDLQQLMTRQPRLPLEQAASMVMQVAHALSAAHDEGVVHRDLKPENIFICRQKDGKAKVKVLDFGISKVLDSESIITHPSAVRGTPHFMSPEQAEGRGKDIDHRTDIFALGLIFYYTLAGKLPFAGPSLPSIMYDVVHAEPPPLDRVRPDLPLSVVRVVERAISKAREARHPSAMELVDDMARALGDRWKDVLIWSMSTSDRAETLDSSPAPVRPDKSYRDEAFLPTADPATAQTAADETEDSHQPLDSIGDAATVGPADTGAPARQAPPPGRTWMWIAMACVAAVVVMGGVMLFRQGKESQPASARVAPPAPPPARKWPVWTMVTAGVALAAGGVALGMGLAYKSSISDYEAADLQPLRWDELQDEIPGRETATNVSLGIAGAAAVAAVLVYILVDRPAMNTEEATPAVTPTATGAAFSWQF